MVDLDGELFADYTPLAMPAPPAAGVSTNNSANGAPLAAAACAHAFAGAATTSGAGLPAPLGMGTLAGGADEAATGAADEDMDFMIEGID